MSRLCRLRNAKHGDDGQWAYNEIVSLRRELKNMTDQYNAALEAEQVRYRQLAEARQEIADRKADCETGHDQDEATIAELRQQLKDMTERYNVRKELADHLSQQLAASQAREQQLREALNQGYGWAPIGSTSKQIMGLALAISQDNTALSALIAKAGEVMRERCLSEFWHEMSQSEVEAFIRALPAVTLDDLKGGA